MSFSLDFSHTPTNLDLPLISRPIEGISTTTETLVDKITSDRGSLFTDPMVKQTNFLGDAVARIETYMKDVAGGSIVNPSITQSEATNYLATDPFNDIRTSFGNFLMHTHRLSGLLRSQGIHQPGLQEILSTGVQMQNIMSILNAGAGCLPVIGGATGLFSADTFAGFTNDVSNMLQRIERGVATIADITDLLTQIANLIRGIIDKDTQFLQNAVNQLQAAAIGMALEAMDGNPCAHFIFQTISNTNPGGFLNVLANKRF